MGRGANRWRSRPGSWPRLSGSRLARDRVPAAYRSGWREAGIRENLGYEQPQGETGLPRSRPGAMRA